VKTKQKYRGEVEVLAVRGFSAVANAKIFGNAWQLGSNFTATQGMKMFSCL